MKQFGLGVAVLIGCIVLSGCETPKKSQPAQTEFEGYGADLVKKGRAPRDVPSEEISESSTQWSTPTIDAGSQSNVVVANNAEAAVTQAASRNDAVVADRSGIEKHGYSYQACDSGVISGGMSTISRSSKVGSGASLSAISTD